jgi:hypothetical protein
MELANIKAAFGVIAKKGITTRLNVMSCCRSCAVAEFPYADDVPMIWTFGGQGNRITRTDSPEEVWVYHGNLSKDGELTPSGRVVVAAFEQAGFAIDWEGQSEHKAIRLTDAKPVEDEFGDCDKCGGKYELGSREGRCGDCGNCSKCCDHNGAWVCPTCHYECHQDIAKGECGSCADCHAYHHGNCQVYHEKEIV